MPWPTGRDALHFKGKRLNNFLLNYEACCDDALYNDHKKCKNIIRFCSNKEAELLKNLPEVKNPTTFEALAIHLRKLYGQTDRR
jgi:hypothetical protein